MASRDASVLWRLVKRAGGWTLYQRPMPQSDAELQAIEWDDSAVAWDEWDVYATELATRQAAVDEALRDPTSSGLVFDIRAGGFRHA